jgi:hypothetical protein
MNLTDRDLTKGNYFIFTHSDKTTEVVKTVNSSGDVFCVVEFNPDTPESFNETVFFQDLSPILLTLEILGKTSLKFDDIIGVYFYYSAKADFVLTVSDCNEFYFRTDNGIITLKYLHQLQNLFFALTGKELKIKF